MRGVVTNFSSVVGRRASACMVSRTCFLELLFTTHERSCLRVQWLHNQVQDHGRSQETCLREKVTLQLQQQSFYRYFPTPLKCPHLFSHGMTGQVSSGALDQFLSSSHVASYSAVVHFARPSSFLFSGKMGCDTVFAHLASQHIGFIGHYSNRRCITLQPNMSVATRLTLYLRRVAPPSTLACPELDASSPQTATVSSSLKILTLYSTRMCSGITLHISLANCFASWMSISGSRSSSEPCSPFGLICILRELVTLSKQVMTSGTRVSSRDKGMGFQFPLVNSALAPQYTNCSVLLCRLSTPWCDLMHQQRSCSDARASLQTATFLTNRNRFAVASASRLDTVIAWQIP